MLQHLKQQFFYSLSGLLFLAGFFWLLFVFHTPENVAALGEIEFFETEGLVRFPVKKVSEPVFNLIRWSYPVVLLLFTVFSLRFFRPAFRSFPAKIATVFASLKHFILSETQKLTRTEKIIAGFTFTLIALVRGFYLFRYPIHTDEAASYLLFIRQGAFATATFYPIPNNHLLQNLLAVPLSGIFADPAWALRLPPFLLSLLLTVSCFYLVKRFAGFTIAFLTSGLFSFGSFTLFLATQGRGYMLLTLLFVLALGCLLEALRTNRPGFWIGFSLLSVLGFYAVPTFLYPFACCLAFGFIVIFRRKNRQQLANLILAAAFTLAGTLLVYFPVFLVSGAAALINNKYVQALTPEQFSNGLPLFLKETQGILLGGKYGTGLIAFYLSAGLLLLLFLFRNKPFLQKYLHGKLLWLVVFCFVTNLVVYGLLRFQLLLPPPRVMFFKSFTDYLGLAICLGILLEILIRNRHLRAYMALSGILGFAGFQIAAAEAFLKDYPEPYFTSPMLNKQILAGRAQRVFMEEPFYQLFLQYEAARNGREIRIENKVKPNSQPYDFVVLEHGRDFPAGMTDSLYFPVYQDELVKAFRLKESW